MSKIASRASDTEPNTGARDAGNTAPGPCPNPFTQRGHHPVARPSEMPISSSCPPAERNPFAAAGVADLPPLPEPRYISQTEYETNEVVATIRELVSNNRYDAWSGTATELLAAAQAKMRLTDATERQVCEQITDLEDYLRVYDNIYHFHFRSGDVMLHGFCEATPDEDGVY